MTTDISKSLGEMFMESVAPYAATPIVTTVEVTSTSVQLVGVNASRRGLLISNAGGSGLYVNFGPTAVKLRTTLVLQSDTNHSNTGSLVYKGAISAVRDSGKGFVTVTEFV